MNKTVSMFGLNAGAVWKKLSVQGCLDENKLLEETKLTSDDIFSAVGWLARENKIACECGSYKLGDTNLIPIIGKDAGKVWKVLNIWGETGIASLSKLSRLDEKRVSAALGWLGREDKVEMVSSSDDACTLFRLK
ncbi:MAG: winged helix-turn-helix domain-containing protein [Euryarchaeota archaeon]|nr:winged helix-turn-helix domain-containing protein [Euryarchaeota archaeon]